MADRLLRRLNSVISIVKDQCSYSPRRVLTGVLNRYASRIPGDGSEGDDDAGFSRKSARRRDRSAIESEKGGSGEPEADKSSGDDFAIWKWKPELPWISKALEPALQLHQWAFSTSSDKEKPPPGTRSFSEILSDLQRSKVNIKDWSLGDLTFGLFLIYLSQASAQKVEVVQGVQIFSDKLVQELIYHLELANGCYKKTTTSLARHTMLRERNIIKYVSESNIMRPGYYIGVDTRNKLVIFAIRGTHTITDIITDLVTISNDREISSDGFSTHFGTAEAARWYLRHEMETIKMCMERYKGFRLRLVGHSLGGAAAALLAIMLRARSREELGFSPDIITAVGFGTPPCLSREVAETCASFVSTVVLQDDVVPRLSAASLSQLRNDIIETDWLSILEKEDWKRAVDIVTNAKHVISSIQDAAAKIADYAKFKTVSDYSENSAGSDVVNPLQLSSASIQGDYVPVEHFVPGTLYYLRRQYDDINGSRELKESYTLWKRQPDEQLRRIILSGNSISDHKCESHLFALRDVLKSLPCEHNSHFC